MKVVIDTNVLLVSISPRSKSNWLWLSLLNEEFELCVTTDILQEYEEILGREMGLQIAEATLDLLTDLPNVINIQKYFYWQLVENDPDDNKFIDCAIAASANFLVSEDKHLRVLGKYPYFNINLVSLSDFQKHINLT
jgi:uncharacterized protein